MTQPAYIRHRGSSKPYLDIVSKYCWGVGEILRSSKFFTKSQADCSFSRMLSLTYVGDCMVGREGMDVGMMKECLRLWCKCAFWLLSCRVKMR